MSKKNCWCATSKEKEVPKNYYYSIFNACFFLLSSFRLVEKMKHSEDMDLKRVLFSLKTFFQSDKDLVYEFVKEGGLLLLIGKKMPLKNRTGSLWSQLSTKLKSDLCQDINEGFAFSRCLIGTFPERKCSVKALVGLLRREDLYLLLFSFGLITAVGLMY